MSGRKSNTLEYYLWRGFFEKWNRAPVNSVLEVTTSAQLHFNSKCGRLQWCRSANNQSRVISKGHHLKKDNFSSLYRVLFKVVLSYAPILPLAAARLWINTAVSSGKKQRREVIRDANTAQQ